MVAMADTTEAELPLVDSFFVRSRNRIFPHTADTSRDRLPPVAELQSPAANDDLATRLQQRLWPQLPYAAIATESPTDPARLVSVYVDSLRVVNNFQGELSEFVTAICSANLEFRQELGATNSVARDGAVSATLRDMLERAQVAIEPVSNALRAELVALPVEQVHARLIAASQRAASEFATQFVNVLQTLVDQHLAGLVEWVGTQACRYHFFKEVVIQENDGLHSFRSAPHQNAASHSGWSVTTTERTRGRHIHRRARHEHHVMHAFDTTIANTKVILPAHVERLLKAVPLWLADFVRIIDGQIIRERIIEQDCRTETWEQVSVRDEPVSGPDPAIVIDEFVLTGWGPRDIVQEQSRRQSETHADRSRLAVQESTLWICGGVAAHLVACLLAWRSLHGDPSLRAAVIALTLGGIVATWNVLRLFQNAGAFLTGVTAAVIGTMVLTLVPLGVQTLFASLVMGSGIGFLLGLVCLVVPVVTTGVVLSKSTTS